MYEQIFLFLKLIVNFVCFSFPCLMICCHKKIHKLEYLVEIYAIFSILCWRFWCRYRRETIRQDLQDNCLMTDLIDNIILPFDSPVHDSLRHTMYFIYPEVCASLVGSTTEICCFKGRRYIYREKEVFKRCPIKYFYM
jgi:hypothetical protein